MRISPSLTLSLALAVLLVTPVGADDGAFYPRNAPDTPELWNDLGSVGRQQAILIDENGRSIGAVEFWNTRHDLVVELVPGDGWTIGAVQVYAGEQPPPLDNGRPLSGDFPCKRSFSDHSDRVRVRCSLKDELNHRWSENIDRYMSLHADLTQMESGHITDGGTSTWAIPTAADGGAKDLVRWGETWGGFFVTAMCQPRHGHFVDSPVAGLTYETATFYGTTDDIGSFDYLPGQRIDLWVGSLYLGQAMARSTISPLDIFRRDIDDPRVINMARLLQSLDADGDPELQIEIRPVVVGCVDMALANLGHLTTFNFADDSLVQDLIEETMAMCEGNPEGIVLIEVSAEDAQANLKEAVDGPW